MGGGGPAETGDHGRQIVAAIEAVLELGEVTRHVFVADGVEGAGQTGLEVAEQGVGPLEGGGPDRLLAGPRDDRPMAAPGIGDAAEGVEAVAVDRPGGTQMAHRPAFDRHPAEVRLNLTRTGLPSAVVSTAATKGVLPALPRPRLPPERSPPM